MLTWDRIDEILLVGGSTRMPMVHKMLERISGQEPTMASAPEQIVAHGAAIHAAIIQLDQERAASVVQVDGAGQSDGQEGETVVSGADADEDDGFDESVIAATGKVSLQNVNAHSLGVVVRSSQENRIVNSQLIPRNTPLPTTRTKVFGTEARDQGIVRLRVVEGENREPAACTQIGECVIRNLPPGLPQGAPVEVTFRYDASGRLHVRAVELTHQTTAETRIERESGFEPAEIEQLAESVSELMETDE